MSSRAADYWFFRGKLFTNAWGPAARIYQEPLRLKGVTWAGMADEGEPDALTKGWTYAA